MNALSEQRVAIVLAAIDDAWARAAAQLGIEADLFDQLASAITLGWYERAKLALIYGPALDDTRHNLQALKSDIERWRTVLLRWARNGRRDDGSAYSYEMWFGHAVTLSESIDYQLDVTIDSTTWRAWARAAEATGEDLIETARDVTDPSRWDFSTWIVVGVVGLVALSVASSNARRAIGGGA